MARAFRFGVGASLFLAASVLTAGQPQMSVDPKEITFPDQLILTESGIYYVTVSNAPGGSDLTFSASLTNGDIGEFTVSCSFGKSECVSIDVDPGLSHTIQVTFIPNLAGPREAILTVTGDDQKNPSDEVLLSGFCVDPIFVSGFEDLDPQWSDCVGGPCN